MDLIGSFWGPRNRGDSIGVDRVENHGLAKKKQKEDKSTTATSDIKRVPLSAWKGIYGGQMWQMGGIQIAI